MNKPFSIIVEETKQGLISIINQSNLHPIAMEMIIKDIYMEISHLANETKNREKEQYELALLNEVEESKSIKETTEE